MTALFLSLHISVLCTRSKMDPTREDSHYPYLALSPLTFAHICATLVLDSTRQRLITLSRGSLLPLWLHILLDNYYGPVNRPSHPQSRVLLLTRHHPHPSHLPVFLVRLLKIYTPTYCPDPRNDLPFHHLFSTSHFAALVPSFVNWSDLAALGQRSRLPWGRSGFANPDSSAIHNDLRRRICHFYVLIPVIICRDGIFFNGY